MAEVIQSRWEDFPELNFFTRAFVPVAPFSAFKVEEIRHLLQISGITKAVYLPTGLLDWQQVPSGYPFNSLDFAPLGRTRMILRDDRPALIDDTGATIWQGDFLGLPDTPAAYDAGKLLVSTAAGVAFFPAAFAGQAGNVVAVNPGETGFELVAPSGGAGLQRLVAHPSQALLNTNSVAPDAFKLTARSYGPFGNFLVQGGQFGLFAPPPYVGFEATGIGGATSFIRLNADDTGSIADPVFFDLYADLPATFTGWGADGIRWFTRCVNNSEPGTSTPMVISIEILDPLTGASFGPALVGSRTLLAPSTPEASYAISQITQAQLNTQLAAFTAGAAGGGALILRCKLQGNAVGPGEFYDFNIGKIDVHWL